MVAASQGVAQDLEQSLGLRAGLARVIYNPIVDAQLLSRAEDSSPHEWLTGSEQPVLLSVGRLALRKIRQLCCELLPSCGKCALHAC